MQWITFPYVFEEWIEVYIHASTYTCVGAYTPIEHKYTVSLHFILQLLILPVLFPREPQKQPSNLSFSFPFKSEWGWDRENNAKLRSCFAIKKHKFLDLGVGIQNSFLCTLYNVIIVLLLAQHDSRNTTLFSVDSKACEDAKSHEFLTDSKNTSAFKSSFALWSCSALRWVYSHRIPLHCKKSLYHNPV